ncbi:MAG TPA: CheR family methyltransferase [Coriobacteriia bacterium]|nr:CheR family methyltransferase [Coriobacteriia bacterium]
MNRDAGLKKDLSPTEFELFRDWIHQHSGIFLEEEKTDPLRISLLARATRLGFADYSDYFELLNEDEDEFKELLNLITINETSFFRFTAQFDALRDVLVSEILASRPASALKQMRVWSAGCSTGEEPYTIGMTLLGSELKAARYNVEIVGTDVSTQALEKARAAVYPAKSLASLPQGVVQRWFEPVSNGHRPIQEVRDLVRFNYHNLIKEPYPSAYMSGWDVIFCRNVTIYFRVESTRRVIENFYEALNPGGYLFIGHSETLHTISSRFEPVEIGGVFVYRKPVRPWVVSAQHRERPAGPGGWRERAQQRAQERLERDGALQLSVATSDAEHGADRPAQSASATAEPAESGSAGPASNLPAASPAQSRELLEAARRMLEDAAPSEALAIADAVLASDPSNRQARLMAAFAHSDLGDLDTAKGQAQEILDVDPLAASAHYILGTIHRQGGDGASAREEFRQTIYADPDFVLAHFALASLEREAGRLEEAKRAYENVIRALYANPAGEWTQFLGGFKPDLIAKSSQMGLAECARSTSQS